MSLDWVEIESQLYCLCVAELRKFAEAHPNVTLYGFAFDCNSDYGEVFLCLNTPEDLRQRAIQYSTAPPNQHAIDAIGRRKAENVGESYVPPTPKSVEENEVRLRWSLGDWKYQGFNSDEFESAWDSVRDDIADATLDEERDEATFMSPTQFSFMRMVCRVLIRLESDGIFDNLRRTDDFSAWVADHDEPDSASWNRLALVRQEMASE